MSKIASTIPEILMILNIGMALSKDHHSEEGEKKFKWRSYFNFILT